MYLSFDNIKPKTGTAPIYFFHINHISHFYDLFGCTGSLSVIKIVIINSKIKFTENTIGNQPFYIIDKNDYNKVIIGESYDLYSIKNIKKFNLQITAIYVNNLCIHNRLDILNYLLRHNKIIEYDPGIINGASCEGNICILEWWKKSGLPLKYTEFAIDHASMKGQVHVLEWWKNSGLELKYTEKALDNALSYQHVYVVDWWITSGLEMKRSLWFNFIKDTVLPPRLCKN